MAGSNSPSHVDLIRRALEDALRIDRLVEICVKPERKQGESDEEYMKRVVKARKGLRDKLSSRARELPSLILSSGLVPTLLFYLSKTDAGTYNVAVKLLPCDPSDGVSVPCGNSVTLNDNNNDAYALTARAVLCTITSIRSGDRQDSVDTMQDALQYLVNLRGTNELAVTSSLMDYILSFKRAAEALWKGEEE